MRIRIQYSTPNTDPDLGVAIKWIQNVCEYKFLCFVVAGSTQMVLIKLRWIRMGITIQEI